MSAVQKAAAAYLELRDAQEEAYAAYHAALKKWHEKEAELLAALDESRSPGSAIVCGSKVVVVKEEYWDCRPGTKLDVHDKLEGA